jgi:hypothetical protein
MTSAEMSRLFPEIVPQVGANLYLDTALDPPCPERGHHRWLLSGSCVLVAPDKVLTIGHALSRTGRHAVFLPFEGIVHIDADLVRQFPYGDSVVLATLTRRVETAAPVPYWKLWKSRLRRSEAWVGGFGDWKGIDGAEQDGIQRLVKVRMGIPGRHEGKSLREDNLDISWWSLHNDGVEALLDNSGGTLLLPGFRRRDSLSVVALTRERKGPLQICSWVTRDRDNWLRKHLGWSRWHRPEKEPLARHVHELVIGREGAVVHLPVPSGGASEVRATLSATAGLRLQMKIRPDPEPASFLRDLSVEKESSGRFLCRSEPIDPGTNEIAIGIAPVIPSPVGAEQVQAQLCCMFT